MTQIGVRTDFEDEDEDEESDEESAAKITAIKKKKIWKFNFMLSLMLLLKYMLGDTQSQC